jgi:RimJ/RimL family protein N-acetyltransferase
MRHDYNLIYKNIKVRPLLQMDIPYLRKWRNDPVNTLHLRKIPVITPEHQLKWFQEYLDNPDEMCFAIDLIANNQIIGSASLYNFKNNQAEFGKILIGDSEAHGKKAGYNATNAIVSIAFEQLSVERVILHCYKTNNAAVHIYKQVGFEIIDEYNSPVGLEYIMSIDKSKF